jgi:hypothetical protein
MDSRELELETESLDPESGRVAKLLGGLKRVEAPSNFEFGVRARIANGAPRQSATMFPILKVVAPLALVLGVGMAVLLYGGFLTSDPRSAGMEPPVQEAAQKPSVAQDVPPPAPIERAAAPQIEERPVAKTETKLSEPQDPDGGLRAQTSNRKRRPAPSAGVPAGGGSVDRTVRDAPVISAPGTGGTIPLKEAFDMIGMTGELSASGWTVRSIKEGTSAQQSGVKAGDVVESVDGLSISDKTKFRSPFMVKTIRVRRDGKVLDLKLAN